MKPLVNFYRYLSIQKYLRYKRAWMISIVCYICNTNTKQSVYFCLYSRHVHSLNFDLLYFWVICICFDLLLSFWTVHCFRSSNLINSNSNCKYFWELSNVFFICVIKQKYYWSLKLIILDSSTLSGTLLGSKYQM